MIMDSLIVSSHHRLFFFFQSTTMAKALVASAILLPLITLVILLSFISSTAAHSHPPPRQEKLTRLSFFLHDTVSGPNQTAVTVARPPSSSSISSPSSTFFGDIVVMDDPLTVGPEPGSGSVGRAQGVYALASRSELALVMAINLVFTEGEYKGSSLSVVGRNAVLRSDRELAVVGGSGAFRFARGYASVRTRTFTADHAVMEYDVHVLHY